MIGAGSTASVAVSVTSTELTYVPPIGLAETTGGGRSPLVVSIMNAVMVVPSTQKVISL